jgi:drug/metabolite transporter (DMT)-like permease
VGSKLAVAFAAAFVAAGVFAVSAVLQQRAARAAPTGESLSWRLIVDLLHRRIWLAGMGCVLVGYVLQAAAFALAPVAFVEPVIGIEVVLALPLAARLKRRRLGRREWVGAGAVVVGVGGFLALCDAAGGNTEPSLVKWAIVAGPTVALSVLAVLVGRMAPGTLRPPLLAVGAGLSFALMALLTQSAVHLLAKGGLPALFESWQVYAVAVAGPVAFTIAQSAYQAGPLAMSLPVLDSLEPCAAVVLAAVAFRQHVSLEATHLVGELTCAAVAVAGIFLLARSPLVLSIYEQSENNGDGDGDAGRGRRSRSAEAGLAAGSA